MVMDVGRAAGLHESDWFMRPPFKRGCGQRQESASNPPRMRGDECPWPLQARLMDNTGNGLRG